MTTARQCFEYVIFVWERFMISKIPTKIDSKKGAGETAVYFLYMLLPVSLQRIVGYTPFKKESSSSTKNTAQDQSALMFLPAIYKRGYYDM